MLGALPSEGCACLVPDGAHVLPVRVELDHPTDKAHSIVVSSPNLAVNGYLALVEGYLSELHRDHPKAGCAVVCISADVAPRVMPHAPSIRSRSATRGRAVITDLIENLQAAQRDAILTLSAIVGALSMARAVDDPDLSHQILVNIAAALTANGTQQAYMSKNGH